MELDGQCWAWGQFLDATKRDDHVGIYGSSAGIIVLALAERGDSIYLSGALRQLREWWTAGNPPNASNPKTLYARERLVQTLRLAFMYIATRSLVHSDAVAFSKELKEALLYRILPSGLWGNYWLDDTKHDQTPRWFTSAIVLLSFALTCDESEPLDDQLLTAATLLENHLVSAPPIGSSSFRAAEQAAISAALLSIPERSIGSRARRRMNRLARSFSQWRAERTPFFYSYELPDDAPARFRDEYFIVPTEILLTIAGCQRRAPGFMQLAAERILTSVQKNIKDNGAYNPDSEQPVFSVDQAWAAVLLIWTSCCRPAMFVS